MQPFSFFLVLAPSGRIFAQPLGVVDEVSAAEAAADKRSVEMEHVEVENKRNDEETAEVRFEVICPAKVRG
ncbi:hypothetical protein LTR49_028630 [Elasticomyces elasticus]|nr:hypothetical protein LTR49_028630 [Elasticomyces elasticus]